MKLSLGFLGCLEHILSNLKPAKYKKQHNIRDMRVKKVGLPSCVFTWFLNLFSNFELETKFCMS